jgi:hypothetical protein
MDPDASDLFAALDTLPPAVASDSIEKTGGLAYLILNLLLE